MGEYKFLLDINPLFSCGLHDRVMSAMANACVCVTDMSRSFDERLKSGENLFFYKEESLLNAINELHSYDEMALEQIAQNGYMLWKESYTWENHVKKLMEFLNKLK